jgi:hypothetical protein
MTIADTHKETAMVKKYGPEELSQLKRSRFDESRAETKASAMELVGSLITRR